jgi:hypothetical protein
MIREKHNEKYLTPIIYFFLFSIILFACADKERSGDEKKESTLDSTASVKTSPMEKKYTAGKWLPVKNQNYERYILCKGVTENYAAAKIASYPGDKGAKYNIGFATANDWLLIKFDEQISFNAYHNLVTWLMGMQEDNVVPGSVIGIALHKANKNESYIQYNDTGNTWGDTNIGFFEDGRQFFIYLPESTEKEGNLKLSTEKLMDTLTIAQFLKSRHIPFGTGGNPPFVQRTIELK